MVRALSSRISLSRFDIFPARDDDSPSLQKFPDRKVSSRVTRAVAQRAGLYPLIPLSPEFLFLQEDFPILLGDPCEPGSFIPISIRPLRKAQREPKPTLSFLLMCGSESYLLSSGLPFLPGVNSLTCTYLFSFI